VIGLAFHECDGAASQRLRTQSGPMLLAVLITGFEKLPDNKRDENQSRDRNNPDAQHREKNSSRN
jgi:hypothetical protein